MVSITTTPPTGVTPTGATITGSVDEAADVTVWYGTTSGDLTLSVGPVTVAAGGTFAIPLTGLAERTPYCYQVTATARGQTVEQAFTTLLATLPNMTLIGVDPVTGILGPYTDVDGSTTNPITVTYNSVGVDLRWARTAASDVVNDNPRAWARFKLAGEPNADWAPGVGGWRYHCSDANAPIGIKGRVPRIEDATDKAFVFSFLGIAPGASIEGEIHVTDGTDTVVVPFTATTWAENIAAITALPATHYVNAVTGLDTRTAAQAANKATPWKTHGKAVALAPAGAVVELAPGFYPSSSALPIRTAALGPIVVKGEVPVVSRNASTRVVSPVGGPHAVLCGAVSAAPSTAPLTDPYAVYTAAQVAPWQPVQVTGPKNGLTYTIWAWNAGLAAVSQIGYGTDRWSRFTRMQHMNNPGSFTAPTYDEPLLNTPGGFAEVVATSPTIFQASIVLGTTIYLVWVRPDVTPNDLWWDASPASRYGLILRAPNSRAAQLHPRMVDFGLDVGNTSADSSAVTDIVLDQNLVDCCLDNVRVAGGGANTNGGRNGNYPSRITVQDNLFGSQGFRAPDYRWNQWTTQWAFVKEYLLRPAGMYPATQPYPGLNHSTGAYVAQGRIGGFMEDSGFVVNGGCRQVVVRRNQFDGLFNGLTIITLGSGGNRHQGENVDGIGNLFTNIVDDCFEPEQAHTNIRFIDNWMDHTCNPFSAAPLSWGPYYYIRNLSVDTGVKGMGQFRDPLTEATAGTSSNHNIRSRFEGGGVNQLMKGEPVAPDAWVYFVHNTHVTRYGGLGAAVPDEYLGCNGVNQSAAADPSGIPPLPYIYPRNNITRVTGYAARFGALAGRYLDDDFNLYVTTDATLGLRINGGGSAGVSSGAVGATYTSTDPAQSVAPYRTYLGTFNGRPVYMRAPTHTNSPGGTDIPFCGAAAVAAVDALFTDVTAGLPGLALRAGVNPAVDGGTAVCNVSDRPGIDYVGAAPDLGALER